MATAAIAGATEAAASATAAAPEAIDPAPSNTVSNPALTAPLTTWWTPLSTRPWIGPTLLGRGLLAKRVGFLDSGVLRSGCSRRRPPPRPPGAAVTLWNVRPGRTELERAPRYEG